MTELENARRAVVVLRLPDVLSTKQTVEFLHEVAFVMNANRPRLVLDCSSLRECDGAAIHLLLHCLEEAIKRNGDVKLAAVPRAAAVMLAGTGVTHLFEVFGTTADAVNSFRPIAGGAEFAVEWESGQASKEVA